MLAGILYTFAKKALETSFSLKGQLDVGEFAVSGQRTGMFEATPR
jgi:hypothetical protein